MNPITGLRMLLVSICPPAPTVMMAIDPSTPTFQPSVGWKFVKWPVEIQRIFGRGSAAILRPAWQAGQLSGRGDVVDRQSRCELAGGLSAVFAEGVGERSPQPAQGRSS